MSRASDARQEAFGRSRYGTLDLAGASTQTFSEAPRGRNTPSPNDAEGFLRRLWGGNNPDEHKAIVVLERGQPPRHTWHTEIDPLVEELTSSDAGDGEVYHSCAVYAARGKQHKGRSKDRAAGAYAWWQDVDVGKSGDTHSDIPLARQAIISACNRIGLPHPAVVASGSGLHMYWFTDHLVSPDSWLRVARKLLAALTKAGLQVDTSRAADIASILRPPGSRWKKPLHDERHSGDVVRYVQWLSDADNADAERFEQVLDDYLESLPELPDIGTTVDNGDLCGGLNYAPCSIRESEKSCGFLQHVRSNAKELPEPDWKLAAALAARADQPDGRHWFHEVSQPYPTYNREETDRKFDQCVTPPPRCATIEQGFPGCRECQYHGSISTPLDLGRPRPEIDNPPSPSPFEVRLDQYDEAVARVRIGARSVFVPLGSRIAKDVLVTRLMAERGGKAPSQTVLDAIMSHARMSAYSMARVTLRPRIIPTDQGFAVDMADGRCIKITGGQVTVESSDGLPFTYVRGAGPLPEPDLAWPSAEAALRFFEDWLDELGVPDALKRPLIAALLLIITPVDGVTFLILQWIGAAGSGKTTVAQLVASLIDPVEAAEIPDSRPDEDSLLAVAQMRALILMDNVGSLPGGTQDTLCKCATGTSITKRRLYSDADTFIAPLHAPVMITSVNDVISRHDLRDRTLVIPIKPRIHFASKDQVRERFRALHPKLLGALVYLAAILLRDRAQVRSQQRWRHRLTDWLIAGEGVSQAVGDAPGQFVVSADAAQRQSAVARVEQDGWLAAFFKVLRDTESNALAQDQFDGFRAWGSQGKTVIRTSAGMYAALFRPSALLNEIRHSAEYHRAPDTTVALNKAIEQWRPTLGRLGLLEVTKKQVNGSNTSAWSFKWNKLEA